MNDSMLVDGFSEFAKEHNIDIEDVLDGLEHVYSSKIQTATKEIDNIKMNNKHWKSLVLELAEKNSCSDKNRQLLLNVNAYKIRARLEIPSDNSLII